MQLTRQELQVLLTLAKQPGLSIRREELFEEVWKGEKHMGERIVDVRIHGLRQKLGENAIETIRGVGYRLVLPLARV